MKGKRAVNKIIFFNLGNGQEAKGVSRVKDRAINGHSTLTFLTG